MKQVKIEIENMSKDEFDQSCIDSDDLISKYFEIVESGINLSKIPSRDKIARASLIMFVSLGVECDKKEYTDIISEICNFSRGVSLIEIAPRINFLKEAAVERVIKEYEKENRRKVPENDIPF